MFSGIVEEYATLVALVKDQENIHFTFKCSFVNELKIDQSISHNGVCLTVVSLTDDTYTVTAMKETLDRSNLGLLKVGDKVNVERSMMMNGRLDGHIVQGHVDQTATCVEIKDAEGSWYFTFKYAFDKEMQEWMKEVNPWALQRLTEVLLEAEQRGLWNAKAETKEELQKLYLSLEGELEERSEANA